jgi:hypothetical protein
LPCRILVVLLHRLVIQILVQCRIWFRTLISIRNWLLWPSGSVPWGLGVLVSIRLRFKILGWYFILAGLLGHGRARQSRQKHAKEASKLRDFFAQNHGKAY